MTLNEDIFDKDLKYKRNKEFVLNDVRFILLLEEIKYNKEFIYNLDELNYCKVIKLDLNNPFFISIILNSARLTLHSIQLCCENCNLADAHTLIRKYRDDLFFYLYILYVDNDTNIFSDEEKTKHQKNIDKWKEDGLSDLNITEILKYIGESDSSKEAVKKYKLKNSFTKISKDLNDFVHSNGKSFYNRGYIYYVDTKSIQENVNKIKYEINYITSVFLFLLILIRENYIASTDYIDCLDCGLEPEEGMQYWVAPFIKEYIDEKMILVNSEWKEYLKNKVSMEI